MLRRSDPPLVADEGLKFTLPDSTLMLIITRY
jgi:hypothetical protein